MTSNAVNVPATGTLRRPEIEERVEFENVLGKPYHFASETCIDILESDGSRQRFEEDVDTWRLTSPLGISQPGEPKEVKTRVFFVDFAEKSRPGQPPQLRMTMGDFRAMVDVLEIPRTFVEGMFQHQIWDGSGCFVRRNENSGKVERIDIFFRAEWGDGKYPQVAMIANFIAGTTTYLVIECPEIAKARIREGGVANRPLAVAVLVLDECLNEWKREINKHREDLLSYETAKTTAIALNTTRMLYFLCSTTHQMSEHLADFEERCRFLRCAYGTYTKAVRETNKTSGNPWPLDHSDSVDDSLQHLVSGADTCRRWAANYNNRTHLYENMLYHIAAQADNRVNEGNARTNIGLSIAAMTFLPGTFVSGLFSMSFFVSPSAREFSVSHWIWLYVAITVPLTTIVFVVWFIWKRGKAAPKQQDLHMA